MATFKVLLFSSKETETTANLFLKESVEFEYLIEVLKYAEELASYHANVASVVVIGKGHCCKRLVQERSYWETEIERK